MAGFRITDFVARETFPNIGEILCSAIVENTGEPAFFSASIIDLETQKVLGSGLSQSLIETNGKLTVEMVVMSPLVAKEFYPLRFAVGYVNGNGKMTITDYRDFSLEVPSVPTPPEEEVTPLVKHLPLLISLGFILLGGFFILKNSKK